MYGELLTKNVIDRVTYKEHTPHTSPKASKHDTSIAAKITPPRVNAPLAVGGRLKYVPPSTNAKACMFFSADQTK